MERRPCRLFFSLSGASAPFLVCVEQGRDDGGRSDADGRSHPDGLARRFAGRGGHVGRLVGGGGGCGSAFGRFFGRLRNGDSRYATKRPRRNGGFVQNPLEVQAGSTAGGGRKWE